MMQLHRVCTQGRPAEVRRLIQAGHNVNAYDESGWTPLLTAAYHGNELTAREVIRANADVHLKVRGSDRSALYTAAYYICQAWGKFCLLVMFILRMGEQAAGEMVRAKADNDWKSKGSGRTALHIAAYCGYQSLVKLFLETNININEQDDEGRTALMLAVERGHSAVVAELVKAGADISLKDKKGMTAVLLAKSYDMVGQLARDVNDLSREDRSHILWRACDFGDLSMVQSVIEAGCDVDHIHKGQTPAMMATLRGHDSIVRELILANCDVNLNGKVYFSDLASWLSKIWPGAGAVFLMSCFWMLWMTFNMDVPTEMCYTPVMGSVVLVAIVVGLCLSLAILSGIGVLPVLWNVVLRIGIPGVAMVLTKMLVAELGQLIWIMAIIMVEAVVVIPSRTSIAAVIMTFCMSAFIVIQFVVRVSVVWSSFEAMALSGGLAVGITTMGVRVLKRMALTSKDLVVGVLVGFPNVELFAIAAACIRSGRNTFLFHEHLAAQMLMKLLVMVVFMGIPVVVLRTQKAVVALFRGSLMFCVLEAAKCLNVLSSLDKLNPGLVVLFTIRAILVDVVTAAAEKTAPRKWGIVILHLMVAVIEIQIAAVISEPKHESYMQPERIDIGNILCIALISSMMAFTLDFGNGTALHYAAEHNQTKCGVLLVEAGGDVRAKNRHYRTPLEIGSKTFVDEVQKALSFTTKRVIAVIGNSEHGKSTLVAALEQTSDILWKKAVNHFKKVHDIRQRTTGIEAVHVSNQKYGEVLFYDFAGQSQYHGPHQSFLEAMLGKPEVSVTLLLLVKATEEEDIIRDQLYRWLQPLALMSTPSTPQVIIVGSFLDQVKSKKEASEKLLRCSQSVKTELALDIQGPCLLDCRQPESKGIDQICTFLQEARPVNTKALPYNLHWVLVQVRKAFPVPALRLREFWTWLQENAVNLPRNLPTPKEACQDLSAAGHTLFIVNKEHLSKSWLILDLPGLLHKAYGTLFSGSQNMYSASKFGLLHCSQLNELFPELCPEVIQEVLKCLEFCIQIDPALLEEELLQLCMVEGGEGWLYFPALVSAQPSNVFPEDPDTEQFQWLCWQLRTAEKHFTSAHLLQTIIIRLAANHVFTHKLAPRVRKHCCRVWVNGISWRSTKGVDIAIQINDNSVVQVVGRSKVGSERLHQYTSTVVRDIIKTTTQLSSKLEATPYIVHPYTATVWEDPKAVQTDSLYPVSSISRCISNGDDHVLSLPKEDGDHPQQMSLSEVFGWSPSLAVVQVMDFADPSSSSAGELNVAIVLPILLPSALCNQKQLVVIAQTYTVQGYKSVCLNVFAK